MLLSIVDANEDLQENVVSFYEAVERVNQQLPIINKTYNQHLGWQFLFTMKQNEYLYFLQKVLTQKKLIY
jgi:CRISPR-associated endonuclease Csn1